MIMHNHFLFSKKLSRTNRLRIVILISSLIFLVEIIVGFLSHSLVLIADAFHVISDLFGYIVILNCMKLVENKDDDDSQRKQTNSDLANIPIPEKEEKFQKKSMKNRLSFGWNRIEILGAFFNGSFLIALSLSIFLQSLDRFVNPTVIQNPRNVVIVGAVSLTLNILSAFIFHEHPEHAKVNEDEQINSLKNHTNHRHRHTPHKKGMNLASMGVFIHILGDSFNSVGVIIVGLISWFVKDSSKKYADPWFSIAISTSIFFTSLPLLIKSSEILLHSTPQHTPQEYILEDLIMLKVVEQIHDLHIWQIDQETIIASAHIIIGKSDSEDEDDNRYSTILKEVRNCFHAWGIHSVTLQLEYCPQTQKEESNQTETIISNSSPERIIFQKRRHNNTFHPSLSCLADREISCQCTLDSCPFPSITIEGDTLSNS